MFSASILAAVFALQSLQPPADTNPPEASQSATVASTPLGGPAVAPHVTRATLVQYDFNNRIRRLETEPELAAIALLKLPADIQQRADAVLQGRVAAIDRFVAENIMLFGQLDTAGKAGRTVDSLVLLRDLYIKFKPILQKGPLRDQVAAALPPEQAADFRRVFGEYWNALVAESLRDARAKGKRDAWWQIDLALRFEHLGKEIERSYQRQADSGTLFIDYFLAGIELTPEQTRILTQLKLDLMQRTNFRPSEKEQGTLAIGMLAYLNESQRTIVLKRIVDAMGN